jgi:hypothetical protein
VKIFFKSPAAEPFLAPCTQEQGIEQNRPVMNEGKKKNKQPGREK